MTTNIRPTISEKLRARGFGAVSAGWLLAVFFAFSSSCVGWSDEHASVPEKLGLALAFAESFEGNMLDRRTWRTSYGPGPDAAMTIARRSLHTNRERQVYVDPAYLDLGLNPFSLSSGALTIRAAPLSNEARSAVRAQLDEEPERLRHSALSDVRYSSGLITSYRTFTQKYGYFEARMRWSGGKGIWPAFWLLPADLSWPPELDVMEAHGDKPRRIVHTVHSKHVERQHINVSLTGDPGEWHDYGMLWTPKQIIFFIDNRETGRALTPPDAHQPMFLVANLAIGGTWPGDPDAETPFPATLEIAAIRAWRLGPHWSESRLSALD